MSYGRSWRAGCAAVATWWWLAASVTAEPVSSIAWLGVIRVGLHKGRESNAVALESCLRARRAIVLPEMSASIYGFDSSGAGGMRSATESMRQDEPATRRALAQAPLWLLLVWMGRRYDQCRKPSWVLSHPKS